LFIVVVVDAWDVMPSCIWLHAIEVIVTGHRGLCVGIVMLSLACRCCHVCVGWVVVSIFLIYACFSQLIVVQCIESLLSFA
jgi:hypothetical protein